MSSDKVIHLTKDNFDNTVKKFDRPVLVDFWASWCGPCRTIAPTIDELAEEFDGRADICKLDIDAEGSVAAEYGVMSIPTLLLFKRGELVERMVGARGKQQIAEILEKHL